jgi:hypothetical protein
MKGANFFGKGVRNFIGFALLLCIVGKNLAQPNWDTKEELITAIKSVNVQKLSNYLAPTVELTMPDKSDSYNKSQAEIILKDFYNLHPIKEVQIVETREELGKLICTGKFITKKGTFNFYITAYKKNKTIAIEQIVIEN